MTDYEYYGFRIRLTVAKDWTAVSLKNPKIMYRLPSEIAARITARANRHSANQETKDETMNITFSHLHKLSVYNREVDVFIDGKYALTMFREPHINQQWRTFDGEWSIDMEHGSILENATQSVANIIRSIKQYTN